MTSLQTLLQPDEEPTLNSTPGPDPESVDAVQEHRVDAIPGPGPVPDPEPEPEPAATSSSDDIAAVAAHLETVKLFGDKRRYIESLSDEIFDFNLKIESMENTIGLGLGEEFRGGKTCIGTVNDIEVGVRMPNTMELRVGQEIYVEAKLLEYRSVIKRFEFEHL